MVKVSTAVVVVVGEDVVGVVQVVGGVVGAISLDVHKGLDGTMAEAFTFFDCEPR